MSSYGSPVRRGIGAGFGASLRRGLAVAIAVALSATAATAAPLIERLTPEVLAVVWPDVAEYKLGAESGKPPAIPEIGRAHV